MNTTRQGKILIDSEISLLSLLSLGHSVKRIASDSGRTPQTISAGLKRLMEVAKVENHFQLGSWYENAKRLHIALGGE